MALALQIMENTYCRGLRRERIFRDRTNIMDTLDDHEIISRYRLNRETIFEIVESLHQVLERPTLRNCAIPPLLQILTTLRYYAKGGFLSEIADLHGISRATGSRVITEVTEALCQIYSNKIRFSTDPNELRVIKLKFYEIGVMPNVVGAIDGTLIPIVRPVEDEQVFVCRNNYHALNVQAVCDADMKFTNVVAKWPGSTHDSFIWNNCALQESFQNNQIDGWLLGDSGYTLKQWLLTPILHPLSVSEERYNNCHKRTRSVIERAFGVLKSRFRCLHKTTGCLLSKPLKSSKIVVACFILHNICIEKSIPSADEALLEVDDDAENVHLQDIQNEGSNTRASLIRQRFN